MENNLEISNLSNIEVLPSQVVDQIAAGEVVERPAHLVKELVENSIDAKATEISVEYADGGRWIKVTDNGIGISEMDLSKALDRFATSKIRESDDLWKLQTFGFRGEALASIASVSSLTLISRQPSSNTAFQIQSQFGKRGFVEKVGGGFGTSLIVEELFANVPARLKFMRSAASEGTQIKNVLRALALSNYKVCFRVVADGSLVFQWPAVENRLNRVKQVLEIENLYEGSAERENVKSYSVFADPRVVQKTSKNIWLFAQDRWIQDRGLQAAVQEAYRHLLMQGEYPVCVSWVETDPSAIDVNIHPTKSQVKFLDQSLAFRSVQASVREVLEKAPWISSKETSSSHQKTYQMPLQQELPLQNLKHSQPQMQPQNLQFEDVELKKNQFPQKNWFVEDSIKKESPARQEDFVKQEVAYWSQFQVLGQANLTYILTQSSKAIMIVDQHAAHERVIFERLMKAWKEGKIEIQNYLFPLAIDMSPDKVEVLLRERESILRVGLDIEGLGPSTIGVRAAPVVLKEKSIAMALNKMAQELVDFGGSHSLDKIMGDVCAIMACHSAVRAGQALSSQEMKTLLNEMDEFPQSSFCPHGRPVSVEYTFYQLEKDFGRIV